MKDEYKDDYNGKFKDADFYKKSPQDKIWHVDYVGKIGPKLFSFDKKKIYNYWPHYPYCLTKEEKEIFNKYEKYWTKFRDEYEDDTAVERRNNFKYKIREISKLKSTIYITDYEYSGWGYLLYKLEGVNFLGETYDVGPIEFIKRILVNQQCTYEKLTDSSYIICIDQIQLMFKWDKKNGFRAKVCSHTDIDKVLELLSAFLLD